MIHYPADFPAAARAAVERALADAEDEFTAASAGAGPVRTPMLPGVVTYAAMWDKSDRATVVYVLEVFETIVKVSCAAAREGQWPTEQLRVTTTDLLAQLSEQAYRHKHSKRQGGIEPMTLDDFTTIVHRELRTFPFWSGLQDAIRELARTKARADGSGSIDPTLEPTVKNNVTAAVPRRQQVDAYIDEVLKRTDRRITRKEIWTKAGYLNATEFQRWQRNDKRSTAGANSRFMKILTNKPHLPK